MKSTEGRYYPNLDHVRALAAFLVFSWHFTTESVPVGGHPTVPLLAVIAQGHCGVSLFMVLSAYLFAKLLSGRDISIWRFYYNRVVRLFPLLIVVLCVYGFIEYRHGGSLTAYFENLPKGLFLPSWPGGAWSITTELHFYVLLPLLLLSLRTRPYAFGGLLLASIGLRAAIWHVTGTVQMLAYFTIIGRIDQFLFGMLAAKYGDAMKGRHWVALAIFAIFTGIYFAFDGAGGFLHMPNYPSPSWIWIVLPTVEGAAFGALIAYYDRTFSFKHGWISRAIALAGAVSYSAYLIHPFILHTMFRVLHHFAKFSTVNSAMAMSVVGYFLLIPVAWISYRVIEVPFLQLRVRYTRK